MATEPREMEDLTRISGSLLVNIGTMRAENLEGMVMAGESFIPAVIKFLSWTFTLGSFANKFRKPVVFDPVGMGASAFRKENVKSELMQTSPARYADPPFVRSPTFYQHFDHWTNLGPDDVWDDGSN